ncbi:MAG: hypothetical protein OES84_05505, partial [Kiritimatiellaceae bacterium]|nr:hypothetical protein [Kiritimatiellaceae bacterium]
MEPLRKIPAIIFVGLTILATTGFHTCVSVKKTKATQNFHTCADMKKQETVVLLHGLARSGKAMNKMEKLLKAEGYTLINHSYPSTS